MALPQQLTAQTINNPDKGGFWSSTPASNVQLGTKTQGQQQLIESMLPQAQSLIQMLQQRLGGQQGPQPLSQTSQQAIQRFHTQTIPTLAERFSSLAGDSRGSSGLIGQLGAAAGGLEQGLAAQEEQFGQQQNNQLMQLLQMIMGGGLQNQFENIYDPGANAGWQNTVNAGVQGFGQGVGKAAGMYMGGMG